MNFMRETAYCMFMWLSVYLMELATWVRPAPPPEPPPADLSRVFDVFKPGMVLGPRRHRP